jgi:hypothetical protein
MEYSELDDMPGSGMLYTLKQDGLFIKWIPESLRTIAMCRAALQNCGAALIYVPKQYIEFDEELQMDAVCQNGRSILILDSMEINYSDAVWRTALNNLLDTENPPVTTAEAESIYRLFERTT